MILSLTRLNFIFVSKFFSVYFSHQGNPSTCLGAWLIQGNGSASNLKFHATSVGATTFFFLSFNKWRCWQLEMKILMLARICFLRSIWDRNSFNVCPGVGSVCITKYVALIRVTAVAWLANMASYINSDSEISVYASERQFNSI